MKLRAATAISAALGTAAMVSPAAATFPGKNGVIVAEREGPCDYGTIYTVRPDGRKKRRIASGSCKTPEAVFAPTWSPDGRRLTYLSARPCWMCGETDEDGARIVTARADGSRRRVVAEAVNALAAEWAPDGSRLVWASGNSTYVGPLTDPHQRYISEGSSFGWSPDGRQLAVSESSTRAQDCSQVSIYNVSTSSRVSVLAAARDRDGECRARAAAPDWSPDGRRITYTAARDFDRRPGEYDIFVIDRAGTNRKRLTKQRGLETQPVWSPDGRFIAYAKRDGRRPGVYVMRADGTQKRRILKDAFTPAWRPLPQS